MPNIPQVQFEQEPFYFLLISEKVAFDVLGNMSLQPC